MSSIREEATFRFVAIDDGDKIVGYGSTIEEIKDEIADAVEDGKVHLNTDVAIYIIEGIVKIEKKVNVIIKSRKAKHASHRLVAR